MKRPVLLRVEQVSSMNDLCRCAARASEAGFDGIELALTPFSNTRISDTCEESFLAGDGAGPPVELRGIATELVDTDLETALLEVSALLARAATARANCLCLKIPQVCQDAAPNSFSRYQEALNFAYELLHRGRHDAETAGVPIALEAPARGCLLSPVELRGILDSANSWAVGACVDASARTPVVSPSDWLKTLTHRVHAVRLGHLVGPGLPSDRPMAQLAGNLRLIANVLDEIGYAEAIIVHDNGDLLAVRQNLAKHGYP